MKRFKKWFVLVLTLCVVISMSIGAGYASELEDSGETEDEYLLNYVVIARDNIATPDVQSIFIDIANCGEEIESATLYYDNVTTNCTYEQEYDWIADDTLVFELVFEDASLAGEYVISRIDYTVSGILYSVNFAEVGMDARFGVDTWIETNPYAWITEESDEQEDLSGIIIKDAEEDLLAEDIETAVSASMPMSTYAMSSYSLDDSTQQSRNANTVIVLDPGHGGTDSGACRTYDGVTYIERDLNLKIAQACKNELEKYEGVTVYMTRSDNNTKLGLTERAEYAKSVNADYLISIHINATSAEVSSTNGAEVIIPNSNYNLDIHNAADDLGNRILEKLSTLGIVNRGTYSRNTTINERYEDGSLADYYTVIYASKVRGITGMIVEHAYISNPSDVSRYLTSDSSLATIGVSDARAIAGYLNINLRGDEPEEERNYITVYNGVDYSAVYDYEYYMNRYSDLQQVFGSKNDEYGAIKHFVNNGMREGRQASENFDVNSYRLQYQDLRKAFGNDLKKYYMHYIRNGEREGRIATGTTSLQDAVTVYNGVDYSAVYDYNYYMDHYSDLQRVFGSKYDDAGALAHFVNSGMREGRQAKESFDVNSYRMQYQDLRKAFGNDLKKYYMHYIRNGEREGRIATGTTSLQDAVTVYNGVDYSAVYDYNYYMDHYSDLQRVFGSKYDDAGALAHFVNWGMQEGRQAKETFNVNYYRSNYYDLNRAYGNNLQKYYIHYITYGYKEGRIANQQVLCSIMGNSTTNVNQMMAYYNANAVYPDFYASSDAPTLEQFCRIYLEECNAEGVRAEVAFAQAMKETGFLRYGGDVSINQYNFAGLGATGNGVAGTSFSSVREGIRAQVQHLKAYGSTEVLNNPCVDGRFQYVTRGTAPYVEWLGIKENPYGKGWAIAAGYGYSIKNDYINKLLTY